MNAAALALRARTAAYLRPAQVVRRARLQGQRALLRRWPRTGRRLAGGPRAAAAAGWPPGFSPVDRRTPGRWPGLTDLAAGRLTLLGVAADLDGRGWRFPDAPLLWRFHLHYWDWAWGLVDGGDRLAARAVFARLWRSWRAATEFGRGDAWLPYPAALRAWAWCGLHRDLVAGSDMEPAFLADLAAHAGFLRHHLETDVGGNHLIKDLKALVGLGVFFRDERLLRRALRRLTGQTTGQVLPDGGHCERAPAYHCQVLGDLLDVAGLLGACGRPVPPELTSAIIRMRRWLGAVLGPDGLVPMLNDGYPVERELIAALDPVPPADGPLLTLNDSGLVRARSGGWRLLADVGTPGPARLPAHAHAGTLGCLLHVGGVALLADTATSGYEPGPARDYERSTAAHSTVEVDGANSTEVWGSFRAGRRARVRDASAAVTGSRVTCEAAHDGYRRLRGRPVHHRRWTLTGTGLWADDLITGRGRHVLAVRWHLAPGNTVRVSGDTAEITGPAGTFAVTVKAAGPASLAAESGPVASGFGATTDAPVLVCHADAVLPLAITTIWRQITAPPPAAGPQRTAAHRGTATAAAQQSLEVRP
jgi:uncharacterized heparinase superfamily protein